MPRRQFWRLRGRALAEAEGHPWNKILAFARDAWGMHAVLEAQAQGLDVAAMSAKSAQDGQGPAGVQQPTASKQGAAAQHGSGRQQPLASQQGAAAQRGPGRQQPLSSQQGAEQQWGLGWQLPPASPQSAAARRSPGRQQPTTSQQGAAAQRDPGWKPAQPASGRAPAAAPHPPPEDGDEDSGTVEAHWERSALPQSLRLLARAEGALRQ